jgi:hypothetical protein
MSLKNIKTVGLETLFQVQEQGDTRWYDSERFRADSVYRQQVLIEHVLGIHDQTTAFANSTGWKRHALTRSGEEQESKEQLVDIVKWAFSMMILMGMDHEQFTQMFMFKTNLLNERWQKQMEVMSKDTNVVLWDLDGVLAQYSEGYEAFLSACGLNRLDENRDTYSFYKVYGITRQQEEEYHHQFITSGGFKTLGVYRDTADVVRWSKGKGLVNIAITARPSWIYKRLVQDTYNWLKDNGLEFDMVLWDKDKSDAVINHIMPANILCFIEDRDKHAIELSHIGVDVLLVDREYNRSIQDSEHIRRIHIPEEIVEYINAKLTK